MTAKTSLKRAQPHVLIVDDEPAIRNLLAMAFEQAGYTVQTAANAFNAIELYSVQTFDAVLSDVQMPGMDGHELIRTLVSRNPEVRSVLMSGYDLTCCECPYSPRCTLLRKPFHPKDAVAAVAESLDGSVPG